MKDLVLDASVVVKLFVDGPDSDRAADLVREAGALHAPDLLWAEVGNVLWKLARARELTQEQASELLVEMLRMPIRATPCAELAADALTIALRAGCTTYDGLYVAAALRRQAVLLTADERLVRRFAGGPMASRVRGLRQ